MGKWLESDLGDVPWCVISPRVPVVCAHWSKSWTGIGQHGAATSVHSTFTPHSITCSASRTSRGLLGPRLHHSEARIFLVLFCPYSPTLSIVPSECSLTYQKFKANIRNEDLIHSKSEWKERGSDAPLIPPHHLHRLCLLSVSPSQSYCRHRHWADNGTSLSFHSPVYTRVHPCHSAIFDKSMMMCIHYCVILQNSWKALYSNSSSLPLPYLREPPIPLLFP